MIDIMESGSPLVLGLVLTAAAVLWTILLVRIVGLRAFSKMTAFDFVTTIAAGSLIAQAGTRNDWSEYFQALAAIGGLFLTQWLLAKARQRWTAAKRLLKNQPMLLMEHGRFLEDAMRESRVSRDNLFEKLRANGVADLAEVRAVVLETTGDISIIRGDTIDERLMEGVRKV
jgi:uncharacterized membrane protein YcaP (DUF421 family)